MYKSLKEIRQKKKDDCEMKSKEEEGNKMATSPSSQLSPSSPSDCGLHRVVEPYNPQHDGEIQLLVGDILINVKDLGNGWTLGKNVTREAVGIFPAGFIAPMATFTQPARPAPPPPSNPRAGTAAGNPTQPPPPYPANKRRQKEGTPVASASPATMRAHREAPSTPTGSTRRKHSNHEIYPPHTYQNQESPSETYPDPPPPIFSSYEIPDPDAHDCTPGRASTLTHGACNAEADFTPSEVEYSSLPSPGKKNKKPHMVVKPNQGKGSPQEGSSISEEDCSTTCSNTPTGMRPPPPQPPKRMTPTTPRRELQHAATAAAVVPCCSDLQPDEQYPCTMHDRATSPRLPLAVAPTEHTCTHLDNECNDNIQIQNSPHMTPKERYADIKRTYYKEYRATADGNPPTQVVDPGYPPANTRYKPILKNRNQRVGDSKGQHITFREPPAKNKSARLTLSILSGLLFGLVLFCWMYFCLDYPLFVAVVAAGVIGIMLCIIFALSRLCRCTAALLLPSVCTTRGRIAFLILITGFLLEGPVTNVYHNMAEVSRSMACSAEQSYNQTMLLLKPFDAMMVQLNSTIVRLQRSSYEVSTGLAPLDAGLDKVEMDIENGQIQLRGTQKTCRTMVDNAYNSCSSGIHSAQEQCQGVMGALATVYHDVLDVLEAINPEKWASKTQQKLLLKKRQALTREEGGEIEGLPDMDAERDICQPLDTTSVCNALNDSRMLCMPSSWAGEAIQDAINMTQNAMHSLRDTLQFRVQYEPYYNTRVNASRVIYEIRRKVQQEFGQRTAYFEEVIALLKKLIPVALVLLIYVSYLHIRHYMCRDTYDNVYITSQFRGLDQKRAEVAGDHLLPLKKYERNYLVDTSSCDLSAPEDGLYRAGLCVLMLHLGISFCCFMFDFILFWVLALVRRHGHPEFDFTGRESLDFVVTGEGVIVDLLNIFLRGFHPGHWFGFTANNQACLPAPRPPSLNNLIVVFMLYLVLLLSVLLKAYLLRLRNLLTGFFYPEREKARIVHLYNVILNQRARMLHLLHQRAKITHRERALQEQVGFCHQLATRCAPCRPFLYDATRCLVCDSVEDQTFRDCETERCQGVYCFDCFEDLGNVCPLCLQGDYSDEEDYEELEDDLQPYCRSSKIYL